MMQRGKAPVSLNDQIGDADPAWFQMIPLRLGYPRLRLYSQLCGAAAVGFASGALFKVPLNAQVAVVAALTAIAIVLSQIAHRTLARAVDLQRQAIASMNIRDLNVVDMTTGKVTPAETVEDKQRDVPTEPAPAPKEVLPTKSLEKIE